MHQRSAYSYRIDEDRNKFASNRTFRTCLIVLSALTTNVNNRISSTTYLRCTKMEAYVYVREVVIKQHLSYFLEFLTIFFHHRHMAFKIINIDHACENEIYALLKWLKVGGSQMFDKFCYYFIYDRAQKKVNRKWVWMWSQSILWQQKLSMTFRKVTNNGNKML